MAITMVKTAKVIKFAKEWSKLKNDFFLTVRWPDTAYEVGKEMPVLVRNSRMCDAKVVFTFMVPLCNILTNAFTLYDADCPVQEYTKMMEKWYGRKADWNGIHSIVRVIGIRKVSNKNI